MKIPKALNINTPAGKYYGGRYTDIPMYACSEKCIPAVECFGYFHILLSTPKANYLKFIQNVSKQKNARFNFALYHLFVRKSVQS
jgi:hypothetical protein